jgi:acyl-CoA synthetase (AMP-forming)/AMP-acid ligase II
LVAIVEVRSRADSEDAEKDRFIGVKRQITSAISQAHGLNAADLVLVARGAIPITTSGKIRRTSCVELYRDGQFTRLDDEAVNAD